MSKPPPWPGSASAALFLCAFPCLTTACGGGDLPPGGAHDVQRYELTGEYDWQRDRLVATVAITLLTTEPSVRAITLDSNVTEVLAVRSASGEELRFSTDVTGQLTVDVSTLAPVEGAEITLVVDYEAAPGDALRAVPPRAGDPVAVRAVFTDSEPRRASLWMPCHDVPDDRAVVSFDMKMGGEEKLIANGDLLLDEGAGSASHRMKYETTYPLPTYQMAFAISDFVVEEGQSGDVPVSVWHRPGVAGDYPATVAELARLMDTFQPLLGGYPFEKYAMVMLPEFSGGMENASITFQSEVSTAQPALSASLIAHELGHQWYGDAVTVATWDDLWIKEGMATLLEGEAARPFEDQTSTGVLFGDRFYVLSGDAARDPSLAPEDKYTTGPYDRGGWIWTQIRSVAGEEVFWATLRDILADHRYGTVTTEEVLSAFEPHLGEAAAAAKVAVDAHDLPRLAVEPAEGGGATVTLQDPKGILIAPLEIEWRREDGATERTVLVPGEAMDLTRVSEGDLLVLDPADVHPDLALFAADEASYDSYFADLVPLTVPATAPAMASFSEIAGIHQYAALSSGSAPPFTPDALAGFAASLDGDSARASVAASACSLAWQEEDAVVQAEWVAALTTAVTAEPAWRGLPYAKRVGTCSGLLSPLDIFAPSWAELAAASSQVPVERAYYLSTFDLPFQDALDVWVPAATGSYSIRIRSIAARYVRTRALAVSQDGDLPAWRSAILDLLAKSDATEVLRQLTPAALWFAGAPAGERDAFRDQMSRILHLPTARLAHVSALCAAYIVTKDQPGAWSQLVTSLGDAPLSARAQDILGDPSVCL